MDNLFTYLNKYSDVSFNELPFNEIDALVFSEVSYLNLEDFLTEDKDYSFGDIICSENLLPLLKGTFVPDIDGRLVLTLSKAERYKNMIFRFPLFKEEPEKLMQYFSFAVTERENNYIFFRGTNKTLFGSLEDLVFATRRGPESVNLAGNYLNRIIPQLKGNIMLIGHSKGGTTAECAYLKLNSGMREKISRIYNFDGPGWWHKPAEEDISDLSYKAVKYITRKTIFGLLLNNPHEYRIADGRNVWLLHHMAFSWAVDGTKIKEADKVSGKSYKRRDRMNNFASSLTEEEISGIIDKSRYLMMESGLFSVKDAKITRIIKFIKIYRSLEKKGIVDPVFKEFLMVCKDTFL